MKATHDHSREATAPDRDPCFDAAAPRLSFTAAAEELSVTQSAVSHQIHKLEDFLGRRLFHRTRSRVELTEAGPLYRADVAEVLDRLDASTCRLMGRNAAGPLPVRGTPAFISRWLVPRLNQFKARHSDIEWDLSVGLPPTDFSSGGLDAVIHWGTAPVPGIRIEPFLTSSRFPVSSPELVRRLRLRGPADLDRTALLHDAGNGWETWLDQIGLTGFDHSRGPRFAHCDLVLTAAERGQGVALAYGALIDRELAEGRLMRLFDEETSPAVIYSLATETCRTECRKLEAFRQWLFAEVADQPGSRSARAATHRAG